MEFTTKQKIVLAILIIILIIGGFYVYNIRFKNDLEEESIEENSKGLIDTFLDEKVSEKLESSEKVIVHVTGAVNNEGIVELKEGERVSDAIEKAGGKKENADLSKINLAYVLEDGQKIYVPKIGEISDEGDKKEYVVTGYGENMIVDGNNEGERDGKVNINTANQTELETLPGIGTTTASKIIDYRNKNGKFKRIEDIQNVKGIGNSKFENIKENICV